MIRSLPAARRTAAAALLCGSVLLAACSSDDGGAASTTTRATTPVEVSEVLGDLANDVITPAYERLGTDLTGLADATAELCAAPSEANLSTAQEAWLKAVTAWQGTRGFGVGPAMDERLMSDVGFAARARVINLLLDGDDPVDVAALADEGSAARGLYAAEEALFGEGSATLATAAGARRCEYAASVATLAAAAAEPVIDQWTSGDAGAALVQGLDGGEQSSVDELLNEATHRLEELDTTGLRDLADARRADDLDPALLGGPADQRLADRKALLASVSALVGDGSTGISALVGAKDADTADRLVAAQAKADEAVDALPDSASAALDDPDAVDAASKAVSELKVLLSTEVATKLGVTINFSDSDGDS